MNNAYLKEIRRWDMPVRRLDDAINPFARSKVVIWVLCGFQSGNYVTMKAGMVYGLLEAAQKAGKLKGLQGLVEASSGATGLVLPMIARDKRFGIPKAEIVIVMNKDVPDGKRLPIEYAGVTVVLPAAGLSAIATARELGGGGWSKERWEPSDAGFLNLDQYANEANQKAYCDRVAPQVLQKMRSRDFRLFVCPVGTGGTIVGLSEGFRRKQRHISIVGAMSVPGETISGMRNQDQMSEIRFPWRQAADRIVIVKSLHAHIAALQIQDATGMMVGISAGAAYVATLEALKEHERQGTLDSIRSPADGYVHAMFVAHDGLRTYTANRMPALDGCPDWRSRMVWEFLW